MFLTQTCKFACVKSGRKTFAHTNISSLRIRLYSLDHCCGLTPKRIPDWNINIYQFKEEMQKKQPRKWDAFCFSMMPFGNTVKELLCTPPANTLPIAEVQTEFIVKYYNNKRTIISSPGASSLNHLTCLIQDDVKKNLNI